MSDGEPCFAHAVAKAAAPQDDPWVQAARRIFHEEGSLEVDIPAVISGPEDGTGSYVMAWVWVDRDDLTDEELKALRKIERAQARRNAKSKSKSKPDTSAPPAEA